MAGHWRCMGQCRASNWHTRAAVVPCLFQNGCSVSSIYRNDVHVCLFNYSSCLAPEFSWCNQYTCICVCSFHYQVKGYWGIRWGMWHSSLSIWLMFTRLWVRTLSWSLCPLLRPKSQEQPSVSSINLDSKICLWNDIKLVFQLGVV